MSNVKQVIRNYVMRMSVSENIKDDDDIFALGIVNSLFAMQLILFIEKHFSIEIDEDELELENMKSINSIAALIDSKM